MMMVEGCFLFFLLFRVGEIIKKAIVLDDHSRKEGRKKGDYLHSYA